MKKNFLILCAIAGAFVLGLWATSSAQPQFPPQRKQPQLPEILATSTQVKEADVVKVLNALGPEIQRQLAEGKQVALPGVGVLRVVQIPEHRALTGGRPVMVPSRNYVEFLPDAGMVTNVNQRGVKAAVVVPQFQYNPLRTQTPAPTTPRIRTPSIRVR